MTKAEQIAQFDPNGVGQQGSLFGLPFTPETAEVVIIPVPWEVTVSYGSGTAQGPQAVLQASPQIDFHLADIPEAWKLGVAMEEISDVVEHESETLRVRTQAYIEWLEEGGASEALLPHHQELLAEVERAGATLRDHLSAQAGQWLDAGKVVGVLGGDHSTPLGLMTALAERHDAYGILQIDAHADLRDAYEGFRYSHASIMTNALELPQVTKLVQVGIRDYASLEHAKVVASEGRIVTFYDQRLKEGQYAGATWREQCKEIVASLPQHVYVSFDIDGLDPKLCPHTGTPVAGGFELEEAMYLIKQVVESGREIIGFDLCEVSPGDDEWDGNVGARVLYRLASWAAYSRK